jgi:hypothetical protein
MVAGGGYTYKSGSPARSGRAGRYDMKTHHHFQWVGLLGFVLSLAGTLLAQRAPDKTLVVNGQTTGAAVREIDGHSYVDIENLAQITDGTVTFEADRIVLTIPAARSSGTPTGPTVGLSNNFATAAIASLTQMKEWQGALETMVTFGLATGGQWAQSYRDEAAASLAQATTAATTDSDRSALPLLSNEFSNLEKWAGQVLAERQALDGARTLDPNSLKNDTALAAITDCGGRLGAMLVSGAVADDRSCH